MSQYPHIRKLFDIMILALIAAGTLFIAPKLSHLAHLFLEKFGDELTSAEQVEYRRGILLFGYTVLAGAMATILPCHSFFNVPLPPLRRALLTILCLVPLGMGIVGTLVGPDMMTAKFIQAGALCSIGVWLFGLPGVLVNRSIFDVIHIMRGGKPEPR